MADARSEYAEHLQRLIAEQRRVLTYAHEAPDQTERRREQIRQHNRASYARNRDTILARQRAHRSSSAHGADDSSRDLAASDPAAEGRRESKREYVRQNRERINARDRETRRVAREARIAEQRRAEQHSRARLDTPRAIPSPDRLQDLDQRLASQGMPVRRARDVPETVRRAHERDTIAFYARWDRPGKTLLRQLWGELKPNEAQRRDAFWKDDNVIGRSVEAQAKLPELRDVLIRTTRAHFGEAIRHHVVAVDANRHVKRPREELDGQMSKVAEQVVDGYLKSRLARPLQLVTQDKFLDDMRPRIDDVLTSNEKRKRIRQTHDRGANSGPVTSAPRIRPRGPNL